MLRRVIGPFGLLMFGLGNILGAGIYVVLGEVAGIAGPWTPVTFLLAMVLIVPTALTYAEFASRLPEAAGPARYVQQGTGSAAVGAFTGLVLVGAGIVSCAVIANGFHGYLAEFLALPRALVLLVLVIALGSLAAWGIDASVRVAAVFTALEVGGLLIVLWSGRDAFRAGPAWAADAATAWQGLPTALALLQGAFLAWYAFVGFEDIVAVSEEVRRPRRTVPFAILGALAFAALAYALVAWVAVNTVAPERLAGTGAPLALVVREARGTEPVVLTLIALVAVINGALVQIVMGSRVLYGMAAHGWLPRTLAVVNPRTGTPLRTTALVVVAVLAVALPFRVLGLTRATNGLLLSVFALVNLALCLEKRRRPTPEGALALPFAVPVLGLLVSLAMLAVAVHEQLPG
jgi:APA family basic amino acid/polyamine antiporter